MKQSDFSRSKLFSRYALFCALLPSLLAGGCARKPHTPGVLRLAGVEPSTLDPAKAYDTTSISLTRVLYRGLVDYGDGANIVPALAKEYSVSPDGRTYRFKLREDARYHFDLNGKTPGRRVVADDFRFAIERVLDPSTTSDGLSPFSVIEGAPEFTKACEKLSAQISKARGEEKKVFQEKRAALRVGGIEVKGENEISLRLSKADATFINWLTLPFSYAVPPEWVEKLQRENKTLSEYPNGAGPFMIDEWIHDDYVHLQKFAAYFDPALPASERIEQNMSGSGSGTLELMRFELGEIDVYSLEELRAPDYLRLMRDAKWKPYIKHAPMMDVRYLCMNTELKPFDNKLVRQAVSHAINKERIIATQAGRVQVANGILPPGMPAYKKDLKGYAYNPDKARALLKQAGYKDNTAQPITLWYAEMLWYPAAAQMIQQDLKTVGMTINLKSMTYPELKAAGGQRKRVPLSIMGWLQDYPDPANFLDVLFNSKGISQNASLNRSFYANPKVDELLNAAGVELNRPKRLQMYSQVEQLIMNDAPWVPLVHTERYIAHQPWVEGYNLHPMWSARYEYAKVNH